MADNFLSSLLATHVAVTRSVGLRPPVDTRLLSGALSVILIVLGKIIKNVRNFDSHLDWLFL